MNKQSFPHLSPYLALSVVGSAAFLLAIVLYLASSIGLAVDFLAFYTGGQVLLSGAPSELYNFPLHESLQQQWLPDFDGVFPFIYLPLFATFYLPLAAFPLLLARLLWLIISILFILGAVWFSRAWTGLNHTESLLLLLAFPGLYSTLLVGQNSPLTLLFFAAIAALLWQKNKHWGLLALLLALVLYKPQLIIGLLIFLTWQRHLKLLIHFSVLALLILASSFLFGPRVLFDYLSATQSLRAFTIEHGINASFYGVLNNNLPVELTLIVFAIVVLFIIAALFIVWEENSLSPYYQYTMLWLIPLLITPYVAHYDLLLLALPLSFLVPCLSNDRLLQSVVFLLWVTPSIDFIVGKVTPLAGITTFVLYLLCFWRAHSFSSAISNLNSYNSKI